MNISRVVSSIKQQLGLYAISLPFKDDTSIVIGEVLKTTTIPIYSQFVPHKKEYSCRTRDLRQINREDGIYQLPSVLTTTNVISVLDVKIPQVAMRGEYGAIAPAYGITRSMQGVITSQAYMLAAGQMRAEPTFEYLGFNKIRLFGYPSGNIAFVVACEHDENGESIEAGCFDSFLELAMLDMKIFIYNNLKHYDNIASAYGTINLKVEEWQGAEADRKSLLDDWRSVFHLDMTEWINFL